MLSVILWPTRHCWCVKGDSTPPPPPRRQPLASSRYPLHAPPGLEVRVGTQRAAHDVHLRGGRGRAGGCAKGGGNREGGCGGGGGAGHTTPGPARRLNNKAACRCRRRLDNQRPPAAASSSSGGGGGGSSSSTRAGAGERAHVVWHALESHHSGACCGAIHSEPAACRGCGKLSGLMPAGAAQLATAPQLPGIPRCPHAPSDVGANVDHQGGLVGDLQPEGPGREAGRTAAGPAGWMLGGCCGCAMDAGGARGGRAGTAGCWGAKGGGFAGCWVLGAGCWVLGAGCWVLGAGCWVLGAGCWVLGAGCWVLGAHCSPGCEPWPPPRSVGLMRRCRPQGWVPAGPTASS
jgi:hypothetical protein